MRLVAVSLALWVATARADPPQVLDVQRADVTLPDGSQVSVSDGCWLSTERCLGTAKELAQLRAENATLKAQPGPSVTSLMIAVLVGVVLGTGATLAVKH